MEDFYVYTYLREDGSPYYVGKGKGNRAYAIHSGFRPPSDRSRIRVYPMVDEATALAYERYFIHLWGRKDNGTGILQNHTDGGENPPSAKGKARSLRSRRKLSATKKALGQRPILSPESKVRRARRAGDTHRRNGHKPTLEACSRGGLRAHQLHADQYRGYGQIAGKRAVESGQIFTIRTPESCSQGGLHGTHSRWHVSRGVVNAECSLCSL
jgi:hypothetical protein